MTIVKDLMTTVVSFASEDDRLTDVVAAMRANNHSCSIVTVGKIIKGILTERDLVVMYAQVLKTGLINDLPVSAVMTPNPVCVSESASLLEALMLARSHRVRHLPVVNDLGFLVGIVTHTDMINLYVNILEEQAALIDANTELRAQSREDPLLQVGNRRAMKADMTKVAATAERTGQHYSIALLDLDYFKAFNDHYGHLEGDRALQAVVVAIKNTMRHGDSLYRYGGEELLILMPGSDMNGARYAAERARLAVQALQLVHSESPYHMLTISGGVASTHTTNMEELIVLADRALYRAKAEGRNRITASQPLTDADQRQDSVYS